MVLRHRILSALSEGRKAIIPFLSAGFPDKQRFWEALDILDAEGADILEIGVPFSDPVADGPEIQRASAECLEQGVSLKWLLDGLCQRRGRWRAAVVLMGYMNPFLRFGLLPLSDALAGAGVSGLIVPDLPLEESGELRGLLKDHELSLVPLVGLNTPVSRMRRYARLNEDFVYFVSVMGTTGQRRSLPEALRDKLCQAQNVFRCPVALGFGLGHISQIQGIEELVDAVVFGSSLIGYIRKKGTPSGFIKGFFG